MPSGTLLCGFVKDKDYVSMLSCLQKHFKHIILTTPPTPRAVSAEQLRPLITEEKSVEVVADYRQAVLLAKEKGPILCTGSFYLAGAVLSLLKGEEYPQTSVKKMS